jgi:hypothetical protein
MSKLLHRTGAAGVAAALLLAGCGSSGGGGGGGSASSAAPASKPASQVKDLPADQVLAKAKQALASAKSVHFTAKGTSSSDGDISFDMKLAQGPNATGTIGAAGQELKIVRVGQDAYISGNEALLASLSQGRAVAGKWIKMPASTPGLSSLLDVTDLSKGMGEVLKAKGKLSIGTSKVVDGKQTVALVDSDPSGGGTLYVSAEGTPYPLLIEPAAASKDKGSAHFSEYDAPVTVTPPPASDVIEAPAG